MARQIIVEIVGDDRKFSGTLSSAQSKTSKFGSILKGVGMGIGFKAFDMLGGAVSSVTNFIGDSVTAASNLEQSMGAVQSVFGKTSDRIFKFGSKAADALGLSKREVNELSSVLGAQLKSMGFDMNKAADSTMDLTTRAADMAATFGGSTKDAVEAIGSLMRGERDPIEKYGVSIKQADVNARIMALGLDTSTAAAKKNAEAVATMDLLMEQTASTQGQFAKESDSVAGSQARAQAKFENVSAALGTKLLPIMTALMGFVNDTLLPGFVKVVDWLGKTWDSVQPLVKTLVTNLTPAFKTVVGIMGKVISIVIRVAQAVLPPLWKAVSTLGSIVGNVFGAIVNTISGAIGRVRGFIDNAIRIFNNVANTVRTVKDKIVDAWNGLIGFLFGLPGRVGRAVSGMWDGIWAGFKAAINSVIRGWNNLGFTLPSIDTPFGKIGGFHLGTPDIPYLHAGGIVPGVPGTDVAAILQAGERVLPMREARHGGGITINIGSFTGSDHDIDKFADRLAMRLRLAGV